MNTTNIIPRHRVAQILRSRRFATYASEGCDYGYDTRPYLSFPGALGVLAPVEYEDENTKITHPAGDCLRFIDTAPRGATLRFPQYSKGTSYWWQEEDFCYRKGQDGRWYVLGDTP